MLILCMEHGLHHSGRNKTPELLTVKHYKTLETINIIKPWKHPAKFIGNTVICFCIVHFKL